MGGVGGRRGGEGRGGRGGGAGNGRRRPLPLLVGADELRPDHPRKVPVLALALVLHGGAGVCGEGRPCYLLSLTGTMTLNIVNIVTFFFTLLA